MEVISFPLQKMRYILCHFYVSEATESTQICQSPINQTAVKNKNKVNFVRQWT